MILQMNPPISIYRLEQEQKRMLRLIIKIFGVLFMVLALITAVLDLTRSIANSAITITPLGLQWRDFSVTSLQYFQVGVERHLGFPWLWANVIQEILLAPGWLVFFVLSIMFLWLGRRRKRHWQTRFGK